MTLQPSLPIKPHILAEDLPAKSLKDFQSMLDARGVIYQNLETRMKIEQSYKLSVYSIYEKAVVEADTKEMLTKIHGAPAIDKQQYIFDKIKTFNETLAVLIAHKLDGNNIDITNNVEITFIIRLLGDESEAFEMPQNGEQFFKSLAQSNLTSLQQSLAQSRLNIANQTTNKVQSKALTTIMSMNKTDISMLVEYMQQNLATVPAQEIENVLMMLYATQRISLQTIKQNFSAFEATIVQNSTNFQQELTNYNNFNKMATQDISNKALSGKGWLNFIGFYYSTFTALVNVGLGAITKNPVDGVLSAMPFALIAATTFDESPNVLFKRLQSLTEPNREQVAQMNSNERLKYLNTYCFHKNQNNFSVELFGQTKFISTLLSSLDDKGFNMAQFEKNIISSTLKEPYLQFSKTYSSNRKLLAKELEYLALIFKAENIFNTTNFNQKVATRYQNITITETA